MISTRFVRSAAGSAGLAAALLLATPAARAAAQEGPAQRLRLGLGLETIYHDNLLEYSDGQLATFEAGTSPDRYSIESEDDVVLEPAVSLTYERDRGRGVGRTIRLRWSGAFHGSNATADRNAAGVLWREEFGRGRALTASAYRLPHYYLRQLLDEDVPLAEPNRYRRASFGLTIATLGWRQRIARRTTGSVGYRYERRDYNDDFRERDSNTHEAGVGVAWAARGGKFELGGEGAYRASDAKAEDGDDPAGAVPDDPDVSYHGLVLGAEARIELARGGSGRLAADAAYEYRSRDYTSERLADASHFGREDRTHLVTAGIRWNPRGPFALKAYYQRENNHASFASPNPPATDPASYGANRFGASIEWGTTLWKQ
ncbi:MAG TPA: hypothetical protein VLT84_05965 [Acidobacteriota bacterium]|nr:hypothetical protein [Acidobacteriota bacterium]